MTQQEFDEICWEGIPQQLFHVERTDIDDKTGAHLDEIILLNILHQHPELLSFKSLSWFTQTFIDSEI